MASRRKRARPTNKLHQKVQVEEEEDSDTDPFLYISTSVAEVSSNSTPCHVSSAIYTQQAPSPEKAESSRQETEPLLVLPSDVYHDFEALKNATKLDTSKLMRKLLKDYQRLTSGAASNKERKLDDVIDDLVERGKASGSVLDLSQPKRPKHEMNDGTIHESPVFQDDKDEMNSQSPLSETGEDSAPLDLTTHKPRQFTEPCIIPINECDSTQVGRIVTAQRPSSLFFTLPDPPFVKTDPGEVKVSHSSRRDSPYVIDLDSNTVTGPGPNLSKDLVDIQTVLGNSKPRMSLPALYNQHQVDLSPKVDSSQVDFKKMMPSFLKSESPATLGSHLLQKSNKSSPAHSPNVKGLPTYTEALQQKILASPTLSHVDVASSQSMPLSIFHVDSKTSNIKFLPFSSDSSIHTVSTEIQQQLQQQLQLHKQIQQSQTDLLKSHVVSHEKTNISSFETLKTNLDISVNSSIMKTQSDRKPTTCSKDILQSQVTIQQKRQQEGAEILSFPNFLFENATAAENNLKMFASLDTSASNTTPTSNVTSSLAQPAIPTFFMATSVSGEMVAIPVLQGLPENIQGLQPFAFAPHPTLQSFSKGATCLTTTAHSTATPVISHHDFSKLFSVTSPSCSEPSQVVNGQIQSGNQDVGKSVLVNVKQETGAPPSSSTSSISSPSLSSHNFMDQTSDNLSVVVSSHETSRAKPGRPRGRGTRGMSKKNQNKDMKLVTENMLFPGVYTSILKLPWSRRARNKPRNKPQGETTKKKNSVKEKAVKHGDPLASNEINLKEDTQLVMKHFLSRHESFERAQSSDIGSELKHTLLNDVAPAVGDANMKDRIAQSSSIVNLNQNSSIKQGDEAVNQDLIPKPDSFHQDHLLKLQYQLRFQEQQLKLQKQIQESLSSPNSLSINDSPRLPDTSKNSPFYFQQDLNSSTSTTAKLLTSPSDISPVSESSDGQNSQVMVVYATAVPDVSKKVAKRRGRPPKASLCTSESSGFLDTTRSSTVTVADGNSSIEQRQDLGISVSSEMFVTTSQTSPTQQQTIVTSRDLSSKPAQSVAPPFIRVKEEVTEATGMGSSVASMPDQFSINTSGCSMGILRYQLQKGLTDDHLSEIRQMNAAHIDTDGPPQKKMKTSITHYQSDIITDDQTEDLDSVSAIAHDSNHLLLSPQSSGEENLLESLEESQKMNILSPVIKPRRQKTSRVLKSDGNFMYATFRIKPRGGALAPRKGRHRKGGVLAATAAQAETIANLRKQEAASATGGEGEGGAKSPNVVVWKFHEQYPCTPDDLRSTDQTLQVTDAGHIVEEEMTQELSCGRCGSKLQQVVSSTGLTSLHCTVCDRGNGIPEDRKLLSQSEDIKTECCVTCSQLFQKYYWDPNGRCETCRSNAPNVISSSKLFALNDHPSSISETITHSFDTSPALQDSSGNMDISKHSYEDARSSPVYQDKDESSDVDLMTAKITNNHLFCSLCRKEFSKICDYLSHIKENHETASEKTESSLIHDSTGQPDQIRKLKISKTKKSLSHKTIMCPIEDCPMFFREQKDLDQHLKRKHALTSCPQNGCPCIFSSPEQLETHIHFTHNMLCLSSENMTSTSTSGSAPKLSDDTPTSGGSASKRNNYEPSAAVEIDTQTKSSSETKLNEKPLQCDFCDYRCRQKNALSWHMRKHPEAAAKHRPFK